MDKDVITIGAAEFKAKCLDLLDRVAAGELSNVLVTKRGRPVASLGAPRVQAEKMQSLYGMFADARAGSAELDLSAPAFDPSRDGPAHAELGVLYVDEKGRGVGPNGHIVGHMRDTVRRVGATHRRSGKKAV